MQLKRQLKRQIRESKSRLVVNVHTNEELSAMLQKNFLRMGLGMMFGSLVNKVVGWNRVMLLPP